MPDCILTSPIYEDLHENLVFAAAISQTHKMCLHIVYGNFYFIEAIAGFSYFFLISFITKR